jgi:hypothetical protein
MTPHDASAGDFPYARAERKHTDEASVGVIFGTAPTGVPDLNRTIGGPLDYRLLAQQHRPKDQAALAAEARRMADQGLKPRDIAAALGMNVVLVLHILGATSGLPERA